MIQIVIQNPRCIQICRKDERSSRAPLGGRDFDGWNNITSDRFSSGAGDKTGSWAKSLIKQSLPKLATAKVPARKLDADVHEAKSSVNEAKMQNDNAGGKDRYLEGDLACCRNILRQVLVRVSELESRRGLKAVSNLLAESVTADVPEKSVAALWVQLKILKAVA